MTIETNILLRHKFIEIPSCSDAIGQDALATIMMNLSHYGLGLDAEAFAALQKLDPKTLASWWQDVENELKEITGAKRKIADFVVYKNFPKEVLDKSEAEYWVSQILMYWGFPNEFFTQPVKPREKMGKQPKVSVLRMAKKDTLLGIFNSYLISPARWNIQESDDVFFLSERFEVNFSTIQFKENLVNLAAWFIANGKKINVKTGTDVLRLAAGMSNCDTSLRERVKFKSFKKPERKFLLSMLESCANLNEDVARRQEIWKRFLHHLHPGDYKNRYPKVCSIMNELHNDNLETFNSKVETLLSEKSSKVLDILSYRPGEFRRRLAHTIDLFGQQAVDKFTDTKVLDKLTNSQIVSLRSHFNTVNLRYNRVFPPKGNWNKLKVNEARWSDEKCVEKLSSSLGKVLRDRLPKVKVLDERTKMIKLPTNGEEGIFTRGTSFPIPDDVDFIRTASYWACKNPLGNTWYDNGWNFFDSKWKSLGVCCWNDTRFGDKNAVGALFSGDPTNSKDMKGRAAQLIDLYLSNLKKMGVRFAVWNILCYSRITFAEAEDVFAALQWGKDPEKGNLFEPSRCQLSFPLKGKQYTKYVCVIDIEQRTMTYIDANLKAETGSASYNNDTLETQMPAFMEYINSLPSVYDLFCESLDEKAGTGYILYSDEGVDLQNVPAYVFKPENKNNKYNPINLNKFL